MADKNEKNRIQNALKPFLKRLKLETHLKSVSVGICIGAFSGLLTVALSYILPYKIYFSYSIYTAIIIFLFSYIIAYILFKPELKHAALRVDQTGLHEKAQTMLQFSDEDNEFIRLQREDAISTLNSTPPKRMALRIPMRLAIVAVALLVAFSTCGFLPNSHREEIIKKEEQIKEQEEHIEKLIEKLEEEIEETPLTPELKEKAENILEELKEKLEKETNTGKKLASVNEAIEKFKELAKESKKDGLGDVSDSLKENESTKELGEAIESGDEEKLSEAIENIKEELENLEGNELKEKLEDLSSSIGKAGEKTTGELKDALSELSDALKDAAATGDLSGINDMLQNAKGAIEGNGSMENIEQLLEDIKNATSGEGKGQGEGQDEGQGEGKGEGQGEGQGEGSGEGKGQGSGAGKGSGKETDLDVSIYDPSLIGGDGDDVYVPGRIDYDGKVEKIELGESDIVEGSVPYGEVYNQYTDKAQQAMDRESVPDDIRSVIEKYFSSLE